VQCYAGPYPEMWPGGGLSAEGTRMEAQKAPTGVGTGERAVPGFAPSQKNLACSPSKWCILMHPGVLDQT